MKKIISLLFVICMMFGTTTVFADSIGKLTEIGSIDVDENAGYEISFVYEGEEYCIEYTEMEDDGLRFVLDIFSDKNLVLSDNQDGKKPEEGFFNPVSKDDNINYFIYFDAEKVFIYAADPIMDDGDKQGFFEYKDIKIYGELVEYLYSLIDEEQTEEPTEKDTEEDEPATEKPTEKEEPTEEPTEDETEKNEVDKRKNLVNIDNFEKLYCGELYLDGMNNDFEWGLCTYKRDGEKENVTYFYIKYGETKKEEFLFISDEVIRVKNTVIFDLTSKSGKQITIEKGNDEGVEFDQSVNYLYDYKIRVNLNSDETAKDVFISYKHKDESDYTKEIIDMDDYKESGKLQKELFANNFGQDVIESGKTEIEIYSDVKDENIREAVYELSSLNIMTGYGDNTFRPEETLTRAEAAAIMVRLLNLDKDVKQGETIFSDVMDTHWASGYVNKAVEEGIIAGYGDGTFRPDEYVTYHQMVKMLVCALGYELRHYLTEAGMAADTLQSHQRLV